MAAPTTSITFVSSLNAFIYVQFDQAVTNNSGGALSASDFALSISGGNSSYLTLASTPSSIVDLGSNTYKLNFDWTGGDPLFHPNGSETITVAPATGTSVKNSSDEYWTASANNDALNARTDKKFRLINQEDHTLWFYIYTPSAYSTNNSRFQFLGSASSGQSLTSSAIASSKLSTTGINGTYGVSIISATKELYLDQYITNRTNLLSSTSGSFVETYADDSTKPLMSDGIWTSGYTDYSSYYPIMKSDTRYLDITRPSGSAEGTWGSNINTAAQWGTWSAFEIDGTTEQDMDPPSIVSTTMNSTNNELTVVFTEAIRQSGGDLHTTSSLQLGSGTTNLKLSSSNRGVNEFTLDSLTYSTTTVSNDTVTFAFKYDGVVTGSDELGYSFGQYVLRDANGIYRTASVDGSLQFGATGSTRTETTRTINIANSGDNTAYFYMKVDLGDPNAIASYSAGSPGHSWLYLGSASSGATGSFSVSDFYLNGRTYNPSNYISQYYIYAYHEEKSGSDFTAYQPSYNSGSVYINHVSSSSEPKWADGRPRYDIPYTGTSFGTVVPYDSGDNPLDIALQNATITSSNSSNNMYIIVDFGERVRFPGWEVNQYGSINFSSSISSTSDLSNELTGSFFRIARDYYYTGSIGSTLTITDANFITSPSTSVVSGAWAITASYTGLADGTERIEFGQSYSYYPNIYDDSLNSKSLSTALDASTYSTTVTWPGLTDQYGNTYRLGMTQDALATQVSEAITAAAGGTISAGGSNDTPRASISIPANALPRDTTIGVDVSDTSVPGQLGLGQFGRESLSPLVRLTPHGTSFSSAVTVTFNLIGSGEGVCPANAQLWKRNGPDGSFYPVPSNLWSCTDGVVTLSTTSFSDYIIIGGQQVARTKINNVQLSRLTSSNLVLPEAINITGSGNEWLSGAADSVNGIYSGSAFLVQQQASGYTTKVSASAMASYFASAVAPTTAVVTEADDATSYSIVFATGSSGAGHNLKKDDDLTFNASSNLLSGSGALQMGGAGTFGGDLTAVSGNLSGDLTVDAGLTITAGGATVTAGDLNVSSGAISGSSTLKVGGEATLASAIVSDLTNNRVVIAGSGGALEDDAGFTFDGTSLAVSASGGIDVNQGDLDVAAGAISGSGNLSAGGNLDVAGTGDIADTLTLSKASGTGLSVTANALVGGNLTVTGDLTINGTTTTIDTTNLLVEDSLIEIARGSGSNGTRASNVGAGLYISGSTLANDISLVAAADGGRLKVSGSTAGFDVHTGGDYAIAGTSVLNATTLGTGVVNSSLTSLGTQAEDLEMGGFDIRNAAEITGSHVKVSTQLSASSAQVADLTSGRIVFASAGGELVDDADLTFDSSLNLLSASQISGTFHGDGSNLTGVKPTATNESTNNDEYYMTFVSGATGAGGWTAGVNDSTDFYVESGSLTYNPSADRLSVPNLSASGDVKVGTLYIADVAVSATSAELNHLDGIADAGYDQAVDSVVFFDATDNKLKYESANDFTTALAGDGLTSTSGQLVVQVSGAVKIASDKVGITGSFAGDGLQAAGGVDSISALSITYRELIATRYQSGSILINSLTASLTSGDDPVDGSLQVYLNGMLLVQSGSVEVSSSAGGVAAVWDYIYTGSAGARQVVFLDAIDEDDVVQLRYIKK